MLQLPVNSISSAYKREKTRIVLELRDSRDDAVKDAAVTVRTGRKWSAHEEVDQAVSRLKHMSWEGSKTARHRFHQTRWGRTEVSGGKVLSSAYP